MVWTAPSHKKMEKKFGKYMQDVQNNKTPGMSKFFIFKPMVDIEKISTKDQQEYQSGVGMLLYMVKHSCPDVDNTTRKLSKANNGVNPADYKELLHVIKYVLDTKNVGLKIKPTGNSNNLWEIICFSNSDYAGDPVSMRNIICFILYVLVKSALWQSKL